MDVAIVLLYDEGKSDELEKQLCDTDVKELKSLIESRAVKGKGDPCTLLRAIFLGSPVEKNDGLERRMEVFKHCIKIVTKTGVSGKVASMLVSVLMLETDVLPPRSLAELAALYIDSIKSGMQQNAKSLELLPKILSALDASDTVEYKDDVMTGPEYKSHVLNTLCSGRWNSDAVIHLAAMFKDVPLTQNELLFVINKILRMVTELDLQEIPPLVYQLLLLSSKGHKRAVLEGISQFFMQQDANYKKQLCKESEVDLSESTALHEHLRQVEGTCLLHINFAMKQDQDLGREFLKYLKSGISIQVLAPFNIALSLCLAKIQRFQEQIYDFIKATVLHCYKDTARQERSQWVREAAPDKCDVAESLLDTIHNSTCGWDNVIQGLVQLGFTLMDAFAPKGVFGKPVDSSPTCHLTPVQKACALGAKVLLETFKAHKMVRSEIIEQILNRVVTKTTASASHYLDLLAETVISHPQLLLDQLPKMREAFDYLSYLSPPTADGLIRAVTPLMKISISLKDSLLLVLRKAMFSRQLEARVIAVKGFAMILKNFKLKGSVSCSQASQALPSISASQVEVDVHTPHNPSSNEAVCLEILGNLRRCFTQQAEVRTAVYESLYEVLCRNTQLAPQILALLLYQWKRYYVSGDDVQPAVKIDMCVMTQGEKCLVLEPVAHLLSAMVQCLFQATKVRSDDDEFERDGDERHGVDDEIEDMLESFKKRMVTCDLEDFELDKSADFNMTTSVGVKNTIYALLVSDMCDVLMEYTFTVGNYEASSSQEFLALYQKRAKLVAMLKDTSPSGGGKKNRSTGAKCRLSLKFLTLLLKAYISDTVPAHQESLNILRASEDLLKYIVGATHEKLTQIRDKGKCEGPEGHLPDKLFKYTCSCAKALLKQYSDDLHSGGENKKDRSRAVVTLCLETFLECVAVVCSRFKDKLGDFLSVADPDGDSGDDDQERIHSFIKKFQRMLMTVLTGQDEDRSVKEAEIMLSVIGRLAKCLPYDGEPFVQVHGWLRKLCTEENVGEHASYAFTNQLLTLLIEMTSQVKSVASLFSEIARDLHAKMGDIDQEVEIDQDETSLSVVTSQAVANHVLLLLLPSIDRELDDVEWVIARLRAEMTNVSYKETVQVTQRESHEKNVCTKLGHFVNVFHELVQSAIPTGSHTEHMLKYLTRMYTALSSLVKLYLYMYQSKQGHMSTRFEKLVKHSGTNFTPYVYAMITYIQATQNEGIQQASEKGRRKGGKKVSAADVLGKARIMKETRSIPGLIFAIEQYERYLIQLSKRSKVNLMEHFKMSTSRDFRIQAEVLNDVLNTQNDDDDDDDDVSDDVNDGDDQVNASESEGESGDDENEENQEPASKQLKPLEPEAGTSGLDAGTSQMKKAAKPRKRKQRSSVY